MPEHERRGAVPHDATRTGWKRRFQYYWSLLLVHCMNVHGIDAIMAALIAIMNVVTAFQAGFYVATSVSAFIAGYWIIAGAISFLHVSESLKKLFVSKKSPMPPLPPARPRHIRSRPVPPMPPRSPRARKSKRIAEIRRWIGLG